VGNGNISIIHTKAKLREFPKIRKLFDKLLTLRYFEKHMEACAADVYYGLSEEIERLNEGRIEAGEKPFQRPNYSSFAKYFHWFKLLGLVEPVDRREPAIYDFLEERVFYRLTDKGKAEVSAWEDPVRAAPPEFG